MLCFIIFAFVTLFFAILMTGWKKKKEKRISEKESQLAEKQEQLRKMYNSMSEGFCHCNAVFNSNNQMINYRYLAVNDSFCEIIGLNRNEIVGQLASEISEQGTPGYLSMLGEVVLKNKPLNFETYMPEADKHYRYSAFPLASNEFAMMVQDISKQKKAEALLLYKNDEIAQRNRDLKSNIEITRILLNASDEAIVLLDIDGNILDSNEAFNKLLNPDKLDLTGKQFFNLLPSQVKEKATTLFSNIIREKLLQSQENKMGDIYIESVFYPVLNEEKQVTQVALVIKNITKHKENEFILKRAKEKAEQSDQLKSVFLSNMSHEVRTPMNAIMGFSKILQNDSLSSEKRKKFINIIHQSATNLLRILNDIIDISKIQAGKMEIKERDCNINHLLEDVHDFFDGSDIYKKNVELRAVSTVPGYKSNIKTDPDRLKQVLTNLIANAIKFTTEGFVEFGYRLTGDNKNLEFFIKDTGVGISEEDQKKIFERYKQADDPFTKTQEGTGLGLSICKALVEMLGGKIWFKSEYGKGSTFFFTIPYKI